ncbi:MAG: hypothetical protein NUW09_08895 [Deltaproteobacteria bacterium]|nr:hypothetical protein [Deltaproteobacteria bacterium]
MQSYDALYMWFVVSPIILERLYGFSSVNSMPANGPDAAGKGRAAMNG